jgi:hypothetical protein
MRALRQPVIASPLVYDWDNERPGLEIAVGAPRILADTIAPDGSRRVVNIVFECDVVGGILTEAPADPRVAAVEVHAFGSLGSLDLRPPMAEAIVATVRGAGGCTYLGSLWTPETSPDG